MILTKEEANYIVMRDGRVFSRHKKDYLKQHPNSRGYMRVSICGKSKFVHRMVAEKYVENISKYPCVNHIDGDMLNNKASNLEWCTQSQNVVHSYENYLTNKKRTSKYVGVYFMKQRKKWVAHMKRGDHRKCIGYFNTEEEAMEAREMYIAGYNSCGLING